MAPFSHVFVKIKRPKIVFGIVVTWLDGCREVSPLVSRITFPLTTTVADSTHFSDKSFPCNDVGTGS